MLKDLVKQLEDLGCCTNGKMSLSLDLKEECGEIGWMASTLYDGDTYAISVVGETVDLKEVCQAFVDAFTERKEKEVL